MKHDMQIVKGEHTPAGSGTAKSLRYWLLILLAVVMIAVSFTACHEGASGTTDPSSGSTEAPAGTAGTVEVIASTYPRDAVPEITELIAEAICKKITTETHPSKNKGLKGAGIYVSPYYTLTVNETEVPAYCTAVYTPATAGGVLHSFSRIEIKGDMPTELSITLTPAEGLSVENAAVAPRSLGVTPTVREGPSMRPLTATGTIPF